MAKKKALPAPTPAQSIEKGINGAIFAPGVDRAPTGTALPETAMGLAGYVAQDQSLSAYQAFCLVPAVRACVEAYQNNIKKATFRVWDRITGDEIVGGDLIDLIKKPAPGWSTTSLLSSTVGFRLLDSEFAYNLMLDTSKKRILSMVPMVPGRMVPNPTNPRGIEEVTAWYYIWDNGLSEYISTDSIVYFHGFNPVNSVRGASLTKAGIQEYSCSYYSIKYHKNVFVNNAIPSHILVVPPGMSKKQREDIEQKYLEQFSTFNDRNCRVMVISGADKVKIEKIESDMGEGNKFIELMRYTNAQICALFGVPPIESGLAEEKTRFDTADQERELFMESKLLPLMGEISETWQNQIVDRYFNDAHVIKGKGLKIGKMLQKQLNDTISKHSSSRYVILLDPDSLPIMQKIQMAKYKTIESMCTSLKMSVNEAAEMIGVELPDGPNSAVRDKVFIASTLVDVTPGVEKAPDRREIDSEELETASDEVTPEAEVEVNKDLLHNINKAYREIRKQTLEANRKGQFFKLASVDKLLKDQKLSLKNVVRRDLTALRTLCKGLPEVERAALIKGYFNKVTSPANVRVLAKGAGMGVFRANPDCCDECGKLDGEPYALDRDLPHPNCRCSIEPK